MGCGSGGVENGTNIGKKSWDVTTGSRDGLASTLGDGVTRRVGAVLASTGATAGVIAVVKRRERVRIEQCVGEGIGGKGDYTHQGGCGHDALVRE